MRLLFIIFILFISSTLKAQEGYIFTKEQHDQIRKNLSDYKILIKDYDNMSAEFQKLKLDFDNLVKQYELTKTLHDRNQTDARRYKVLFENSEFENKRLKLNIDMLNQKVLNLEPEMARKDRMILHWKRKYYHERRYDKGDRIVANAIWATMVSAAILAIYIEIDSAHHTR